MLDLHPHQVVMIRPWRIARSHLRRCTEHCLLQLKFEAVREMAAVYTPRNVSRKEALFSGPSHPYMFFPPKIWNISAHLASLPHHLVASSDARCAKMYGTAMRHVKATIGGSIRKSATRCGDGRREHHLLTLLYPQSP